MSGVRGEQIKDESVTGDDIRDGTIGRPDLNTDTSGKAVIRKVIAGDGIEITSDGADSGTGDVTLSSLWKKFTGFIAPKTLTDNVSILTDQNIGRAIQIGHSSNQTLNTENRELAIFGGGDNGMASLGLYEVTSNLNGFKLNYNGSPNRFTIASVNGGVETLAFEVTRTTREIVFNAYLNTRNDGATQTALYTDQFGVIKHGPVVPFGAFSKSTTINMNQSTTLLSQNTLTPTIPFTGNYKVKVVFPWSMNSGATDFVGELQMNGNTLVRQVQEAQDVAGTGVDAIRLDGGATLASGSDQRYPTTYEDIVSLTAGDKPLLDFLIAASTTFDRPTVYGSLITIERFS